MRSLARKPARGNWIWLGGALCAVAVLAGVAVTTAIGGPAGPAARGAAPGSAPGSAPGVARAPGGHQAAGAPGAGTVSVGGLGGGPRPAGPGSGAYLAGTSAVAVFYDPGAAVGSCELGPFPARGRYASLPPERFGHSAACGSYVTVQGPRGQVRAEVVDLCPGCAANMINLSRAAFSVVADTEPGSARVRYWPLDNPPLPGPLILRLGQSRSGLPTVQVRRHGNPLAAVALAVPGTTARLWRDLSLGADGIWVARSQPGPGPFNIRITDTHGHRAVIDRVTLRPGRVIRTRTWMYGHRTRQAG